MKKIIKRTIQIFSILLIVFAWFLEDIDKYKFLQNIFTPKYINAMNAYETMRDNRVIIERNEAGFDEIMPILYEYVSDLDEYRNQIKSMQIEQIANVLSFTNVGTRDKVTAVFILISEKGIHIKVDFKIDMSEKIKAKYFNKPLSGYSIFIFWFGIILNLIITFIFE